MVMQTILISCRLCYAPLSPGTVWSYFLLDHQARTLSSKAGRLEERVEHRFMEVL